MNDSRGKQNYINHVALVLDESSSMSWHAARVIEVVDDLVKTLAEESKRYDQETRVTVYTFSGAIYRQSGQSVDCQIFDKDVLRLPSMRGLYRPNGNTALIDATMLAIEDLELTAQKYGDHSFVVYTITDGQENASTCTPGDLRERLNRLPDNWTMAALVPDRRGVDYATSLGFPGGNVTRWDATTAAGVSAMGDALKVATSSYMQTRASGVRGTNKLFSVDASALTSNAIQAANLTPLDPKEYVLVPVTADVVIKDFVEQCTVNYRVGHAYYQLNSGRKPKGRAGVIVQGNKQVIVLERATNRAYTGPEARKLIGLPDHEVTVDPMKLNADYDVFIQSTSLNRKLFAGTKLLLLV